MMTYKKKHKIIKSNLAQMDTHAGTLKLSLHSDAKLKWQR